MATFRRNRIVTFTSPGMAACNSFGSQPKTFNGAVNLKRFNHIMRARGFVPAVFWQNRGNEPLIEFYQYHQRKCDDFVECAFQNSAKIN